MSPRKTGNGDESSLDIDAHTQRIAHIETSATSIVPLSSTVEAAGQTTATLSPASTGSLPPFLTLPSTASDTIFVTATTAPTASSTLITPAPVAPTEQASATNTIRGMIILIVVVVVIGVLVVAGLIGGLVVYLRKRRRRRVAPSTAYLRSAAAAEAGGANMVGAGPRRGYGAMAMAGAGAGAGGSSPVSVLSRPEWGTAGVGTAESPTTPVSTLHTFSLLSADA
ncbi:hypothetical protein TRAPUB_10254 [Trametes pubescens]|uniref:Mid2 domain-containing protein n=1 Tax=Trametes pubescens TaxID=154538 RepID=A0A1M2W054_TRAPU|nr:hypothetical protein TRAPUB_10254 [Trametes pubescens]